MRLITLFGLALFLSGCAETQQNSIYAHDQCKRLALLDGESQMPVVGAEDMVRLPDGSLLISAYDRRAHDENGTPPQGGLYFLPKSALNQQQATVRSLLSKVNGGLRPHGLDVLRIDDKTLLVGFINRSYKDKKSESELFTFEITPEGPGPLNKNPPVACRANDLTFFAPDADTFSANGVSTYFTADRVYCQGLASVFENVTGATKGEIYKRSLSAPTQDWEQTIKELAFPNGIGIRYKTRPLTVDDNFLAIAETRANQIRYVPPDNGREPAKLPGSPDNLTVSATGIILAAVHPSLLKVALYRYNWPFFKKAPSRIVKVTGDEVLVLFDDPTGDLYSAASVAVQTAGKLVIGSIGDEGLLVCGTEKIS